MMMMMIIIIIIISIEQFSFWAHQKVIQLVLHELLIKKFSYTTFSSNQK